MDLEIPMILQNFFARAFQLEFQDTCTNFGIPQNEIIFEVVGPELQDEVYQNIPKLMNRDLMGGDNALVSLLEYASSFARTTQGQQLFKLTTGVSKIVFEKSIKTREGQKRLLRWLFNFVLVCGFQMLAASFLPNTLYLNPRGCNWQGQPWKTQKIFGIVKYDQPDGIPRATPPGQTDYYCSKSNNPFIQKLTVITSLLATWTPGAASRIAQEYENSASLDLYIEGSQLQSVLALNTSWKKLTELIKLDENFNINLIQFLNWLQISLKLGTGYLKNEQVNSYFAWILLQVILIFTERERGPFAKVQDYTVDSTIFQATLQYLGIASDAVATVPSTVPVAIASSIPVANGINQKTKFEKLRAALYNLDRTRSDAFGIFHIQGVPTGPRQLMGTSKKLNSASRYPTEEGLKALQDQISFISHAQPQYQLYKRKSGLYWDLLVTLQVATKEYALLAPNEKSFFAQVEDLLHVKIPVYSDLMNTDYPWYFLEENNPQVPPDFPEELKTTRRGPIFEEEPQTQVPRGATRSRSNPRGTLAIRNA